jgi:hypothetical protein
MADVWNVMVEITSGLVYVHEKGEVHRDLRPHNSTPPASQKLDAHFSSSRQRSPGLETRRFWIDLGSHVKDVNNLQGSQRQRRIPPPRHDHGRQTDLQL